MSFKPTQTLNCLKPKYSQFEDQKLEFYWSKFQVQSGAVSGRELGKFANIREEREEGNYCNLQTRSDQHLQPPDGERKYLNTIKF